MSTKQTHFLIAVSLSNLLLLNEWCLRIFSTNESYFSFSVGPFEFFCIFAGYSLFVVVFYALLELAEKKKGTWIYKLCYLGIFLGFLAVANTVRHLTKAADHFPFLHPSNFLGDWGHTGNLIKYGLLFSVLVLVFFRWTKIFVVPMRTLALVTTFTVFVTLGRLAYDVFLKRTPTVAVQTQTHGKTSQTRVVWMIFDEMDEFYSTEGKPPGLSLPNFDRFRKEAIVGRNVSPPGNLTLRSIPSFLLGQVVAVAEPLNKDELAIQYCGNPQKSTWSHEKNLFETLKEKGLRTSVVGWYHPYCRLLKGVVEDCYTTPYMISPSGNRFLPNLASVLQRPFMDPYSVFSPEQMQKMRYDNTLSAGEKFIQSGNWDLLYLHWPVPHVPEIPDPSENAFTYPEDAETQAYFRNLVYADRLFGRMRQLLEDTGQWDEVAVLLTADHGWRYVPKPGVNWLKDARVRVEIPYLLKLPKGAEKPVEIASPFNAVLTGKLLLEIMDERVKTPVEVSRWIQAHAQEVTAKLVIDPKVGDLQTDCPFSPWTEGKVDPAAVREK